MMKKFSVIGAFLFLVSSSAFGAAGSDKRLDVKGNPLEFTEIEIINNAPIPIKISWYEVEMPKWQNIRIEKEIGAHTSKTLQLGEIGAFIIRPYGSGTFIPDVTYNPIQNDPTYTETFKLELDRPGPIIISAESLADILKNIMVIRVTEPDKSGNARMSQRKAMIETDYWRKILGSMNKVQRHMERNNPEHEVE